MDHFEEISQAAIGSVTEEAEAGGSLEARNSRPEKRRKRFPHKILLVTKNIA